jgi:hypothetical protein
MNEIICPNPNCGYHGPPRKEARGSWLIFILLFLLFAVPGLLYLLLMTGYRYYCPKCGMQIASHG